MEGTHPSYRPSDRLYQVIWIRRSDKPAKILEALVETSDSLEANDSMTTQAGKAMWAKESCRTAFRVAKYADKLSSNLLAYFNSPEWATKNGVLAFKRQQVRIPSPFPFSSLCRRTSLA